MGYCVEASLIWGIPEDEVPQEWLDDNGCEDVGDVWVHKGEEIFTCHHQGWDGDLTKYVGYTISAVELDCADELGQVGDIAKSIAKLDMKPFDEMSLYKKVNPRLFLICSYF